MKVIVTHEVEVAADATVKDVRAVVLAASRSFCAALAPVGKTLLDISPCSVLIALERT